MDPADIIFPSISGDRIEGMVLYSTKPATRWERIKHHFLHFGEERPLGKPLGYVKADGEVVWSR